MTDLLIETPVASMDEPLQVDTQKARPDSGSVRDVVALTPEEQRVCDMATD